METPYAHTFHGTAAQPHAIDSKAMDGQLTTYADWQLFLDVAGSTCSQETADALAKGGFEEGASGRVYRLICEYCARCLDALDDDLAARIDALDAHDAYGVFLVCSRYCNACDRLLFFRDVEGIPTDWKRDLTQDIRRNMACALKHASRACPASASADGRYYLHCLIERRCA